MIKFEGLKFNEVKEVSEYELKLNEIIKDYSEIDSFINSKYFNKDYDMVKLSNEIEQIWAVKVVSLHAKAKKEGNKKLMNQLSDINLFNCVKEFFLLVEGYKGGILESMELSSKSKEVINKFVSIK